MKQTVITPNEPITALALRLLGAPFAFLGELLISLAEAGPRMRQVKRLNGMTDEELAAKGLTREGEVNRIFGDKLYL